MEGLEDGRMIKKYAHFILAALAVGIVAPVEIRREIRQQRHYLW